MAKLKKAPGRLIGRWKAEAIAANKGASDEELARIINEAAKGLGYDYTIAPEKVRAKTKKSKAKKTAAKPTHASADSTNSAPAPKAAAPVKISLEDIRALKGLVDRIGTDKLQELAGMLSS
jgi:hypothetical protein